jgi:hypothetical protein
MTAKMDKEELVMQKPSNNNKGWLSRNRKTATTVFLFTALIMAGCVATRAGKKKEEFVNLKVLPINISSKQLSRIMVDDFSDGIGASCGFCHSEDKNTHKLNYSSDENPLKEAARSMMKMTLKINRQFFHVKQPMIGDSVLVVTCTTCHRGNPFPYPAE